jgi:hypothetical protein
LYQLDKHSTEYWKSCAKKVIRKRPELSATNSWILHHENAPAHTALSGRGFLATKQITVFEHPACVRVPLLQWKRNRYYIFWVHICIIAYFRAVLHHHCGLFCSTKPVNIISWNERFS